MAPLYVQGSPITIENIELALPGLNNMQRCIPMIKNSTELVANARFVYLTGLVWVGCSEAEVMICVLPS